jgi:plasmid stability protein
MPKNITIRGVPDEVRDRLAARAAAQGRSLQEYLLEQLVELAGHVDPAEWVAQVRADKAAMRGLSREWIVETLRELREGGR